MCYTKTVLGSHEFTMHVCEIARREATSLTVKALPPFQWQRFQPFLPPLLESTELQVIVSGLVLGITLNLLLTYYQGESLATSSFCTTNLEMTHLEMTMVTFKMPENLSS